MKREVTASHQEKKAVVYIRTGARDKARGNVTLQGQAEVVAHYAEGKGIEPCAIGKDVASTNARGGRD